MPPITDLSELLRTLQPHRHPGTFVYATLPAESSVRIGDVVAMVQEPEGVSVIVEARQALRLGLEPVMHCAWITLTVNSDLQAVGLTAAFASALGSAGISCNVVAGTHHDHIFVPVDQADAAMLQFRLLQERHAG
jgi:hypothetical protein